MGSPFFIGIQWDKIYERVNDGPWIPEVQVFGSSKGNRSNKTPRTSCVNSEGEDGAHTEGTTRASNDEYAGFDAVNPRSKSKDVVSSRAEMGKKKSERPSVTATDLNEDDGEDEDSDSSSDSNVEEEDDDEGYLSNKDMRDSIFITSRGQLENKLADWSFIDEQVLKSTLEAGDYRSEEAVAERRQRRLERREAKKARASQSTTQGGIESVPEEEEEEVSSSDESEKRVLTPTAATTSEEVQQSTAPEVSDIAALSTETVEAQSGSKSVSGSA
jgi:hypothetical protein